MVAIKDIDMPKSCGECNCSGTGVCKKWVSLNGYDLGKKRADDCPLIEIEQSENCVSRQAVIDAILEDSKRTGINHRYTSSANMRNEIDDIKALLPVTPTQRWISVSERLPICEQKVLVLALSYKKTHVITTGMYEDGSLSECDSVWHWEDIDFEKWDDENDCGIIPEGWYEYHEYNPDGILNYAIDNKVIAWQPLPKPYKAD